MTLKNITLSADEKWIQLARQKAMQEHKSLNIIFREWLVSYAGKMRSRQSYQALMHQLSYAEAGRHFTRDELNER